jgi:cytidine deaminase
VKSAHLTGADRELIHAAQTILRDGLNPRRHSVGCALRGRSGRIHTGVNIEACGYGPCAEPITVGAAISSGERSIETIVAVRRRGRRFEVLSPCGNCRQLLLDYAPQAWVIVRDGKRVFRMRAEELLPAAYRSGFAVRNHRSGKG